MRRIAAGFLVAALGILAQAVAGDEGKGDPAADPVAARAATAERLKQLGAADAGAKGPGSNKELRETLEERLRWLDEFVKAAMARQAAERPKVSPEREAADLKAEIERTRAGLDQATRNPEAFLPDAFRHHDARAVDASLKEMKEAIGAAEDEVRERKAAVEAVGTGGADGGPLASLRAEREKVRQRRAALDRRRAEREAAIAAATTAAARELARERLATFAWEARTEAERLDAVNAQIALEVRRGANAEARREAVTSAAALAEKSLALMRERYKKLSDQRRGDLARAAAAEQARAERAADPLERYRAERAADMLDLRGRLLKDEQALNAAPAVSPREQADLADRAAEDFEHLRQLVQGGRSTTQVALRLNSTYRRLAFERDAIVRGELARAARELARHEADLTEVEMDLVNDARDDRARLDKLLESLPPARHAQAVKIVETFEEEHRRLLDDRRRKLVALAARDESALREVQRRLRVLDEQYTFLRTRMFWVRDAEPIGGETLAEARGELPRLVQAGLRLAAEPADHARWGRPSTEFALALAGLVALPWPILRGRRALRDVLGRVDA